MPNEFSKTKNNTVSDKIHNLFNKIIFHSWDAEMIDAPWRPVRDDGVEYRQKECILLACCWSNEHNHTALYLTTKQSWRLG